MTSPVPQLFVCYCGEIAPKSTYFPHWNCDGGRALTEWEALEVAQRGGITPGMARDLEPCRRRSCGHGRRAHEHYAKRSDAGDCSLCPCPRWKGKRRWWLWKSAATRETG